jgi:hypothetical protein
VDVRESAVEREGDGGPRGGIGNCESRIGSSPVMREPKLIVLSAMPDAWVWREGIRPWPESAAGDGEYDDGI